MGMASVACTGNAGIDTAILTLFAVVPSSLFMV